MHAEPTTRRFSRDEYQQMADLRFFRGQRVELMDGKIIQKSPQRSVHSVAITLVERALQRAFGELFVVRVQMPFDIDDTFEPAPDVAVVRGQPRDYKSRHPSSAELIVEVSDDSLAYDRGEKASAYARAHVADYWVLNLPRRVVEVRRNPMALPGSAYGWDYSQVTLLREDENIRPLAVPEAGEGR
jgi:Uma2 family endonuclease